MSDLISRKAVIQDIKDLLKSPYAHSQCGEVSESAGYLIRKEMAETIIDICVKSAKTAYDVNKVMDRMETVTFTADLYDHGWDGQTVNNLLCLGDVADIVRGGGRDESNQNHNKDL
ncbi:MAG TPA: hypothetical protein GXX75_06925 [Clostridiales bacterium]|nr:hypothetical protein [Clostridiales bacterium]